MEFYDDLNFLLKNYSTTLWRPSSPIIFALGFHQDSFAHFRLVGAAAAVMLQSSLPAKL